MKRFPLALVLLFAIPFTARADDASRHVKAQAMVNLLHLDKVTGQMLDALRQQMHQSISQAAGPNVTPEEKAKLDAFEKQVLDKVEGALNWKALEPDYVNLYATTYTEEQLDAILTFYKSPAGLAMIEKTPELMNKGVEITQNKMMTVMPEIQKMEEDFVKANTPTEKVPAK